MVAHDAAISVIIPAYNRQATVGRAIKSALRQTLAPLEILVIDDGSTDDTGKVVDALAAEDGRIRLLREDSNRGGAAARNRGIVAARGEFVAFLDSDDEWIGHHLERRLAVLRQNPQSALVFGSFYVFDGRRKLALTCLPFVGDPLEYLFLGRGGLRTSTFVGAREKVMAVMFDDHLRKHQDWDFIINLMQRFNVVADTQPTAILHISSLDRLSAKLDREASQKFYRKNRHLGSRTGWILFSTVMLERTFHLERKGKNFLYYLDLLGDLDRPARTLIGILARLLYVPRIGGRLFRAACRTYCLATAAHDRRVKQRTT